MTIPPDKLRADLKQIGKTQKWLAEQINVTPRAVRMWIAGDRKLTGPTAKLVQMVIESKLEG